MQLHESREKLIDRLFDISDERAFIISVLTHLDSVAKCQRMEQYLDYAESIGDSMDQQKATLAAIRIDNGV